MNSNLISIKDAREELGGISRSTFYAQVMPRLEGIAAERGWRASVKIGRRRLICRKVLNVLLEILERACGWLFLYPVIMWHLYRSVPLEHFFHAFMA